MKFAFSTSCLKLKLEKNKWLDYKNRDFQFWNLLFQWGKPRQGDFPLPFRVQCRALAAAHVDGVAWKFVYKVTEEIRNWWIHVDSDGLGMFIIQIGVLDAWVDFIS